MTKILLGELLVREGAITKEQLEEALNQQLHYRERLGQTLVRLGHITEDELLEFLGRQHQVPAVDLYRQAIDEGAVRLLDKKTAQSLLVFPVGFKRESEGVKLVLAMADPLDKEAMERVSLHTGCPIVPVFAREEHVRWIINYYYADRRLEGGLEQGASSTGSGVGVVELDLVEADG